MTQKWQVRGWSGAESRFVMLDTGVSRERALAVLDYHMGATNSPYSLYSVDSLPGWERTEVVDISTVGREWDEGGVAISTTSSAIVKPGWRPWDRLTDGERLDIMRAENPPSLEDALGNLWRMTESGWVARPR